MLHSHTGASVKHDRTNDPHDVVIPDTVMTDTGQPYDWPSNNQTDQPMPQYSWGPIGPISPRPEPVKRSDNSVSPEQVVPPSAPAPPLPVVKPAAPVVLVPVASPQLAPALPPRRLGGDGQPQSRQKPTTVSDDKDKKFESSTKYRTDTPASGSNDPNLPNRLSQLCHWLNQTVSQTTQKS